MKLSSLHEEVVRSECGGCHAPMGQQIRPPAIGSPPMTGTQSKTDDTKLCPRCSKKAEQTSVDRPDSVTDRTSNAIAQVTQPPGGPLSPAEKMPKSAPLLTKQFHKNRPDF